MIAPYKVIPFATQAEWLALRKGVVGASDIPTLVGIYGQPAELYLQKRGEVPDWEGNENMEWGKRLEDALRLKLSDELNMNVTKPAFLLISKDCPALGCSLDGIVHHREAITIHPEGDEWILDLDIHAIAELKTSGNPDEFGASGTDQYPEAYWHQIQAQLAVTGAEVCHLGCLLTGRKREWRQYKVLPDQTAMDGIKNLATEFMERVRTENPPDIDFTMPRALDLVRRRFGMDEDSQPVTWDVGGNDEALLELYRDAKQQQSNYEALVKQQKDVATSLQAKIELAMGNAPVAYCGGLIVSRKTICKKAFTVKASEYIKFDVKERKEKKGNEI